MPLGNRVRSPGPSWRGGAPSRVNQHVPATTAWNEAPRRAGSSMPHGARASNVAMRAASTRATASTSPSTSMPRRYPPASGVGERRETLGQVLACAGHCCAQQVSGRVVDMDLTSTTALVTGANRGLGRALVDALLDRGAARIYAAARDPHAVRTDDRIVPVAL